MYIRTHTYVESIKFRENYQIIFSNFNFCFVCSVRVFFFFINVYIGGMPLFFMNRYAVIGEFLVYVECYWIFEINKERNFKYSDILVFLSLIFKINHCRNYTTCTYLILSYTYSSYIYLQTLNETGNIIEIITFLEGEFCIYTRIQYIHFHYILVSFGNIPRSNTDTHRCLSRGLDF